MNKQEVMQKNIQPDSDIQLSKPVNNKAFILSVPMGCYIGPKSIAESAYDLENNVGGVEKTDELKQPEVIAFDNESHRLLSVKHHQSLRESDRLG